LFRVIGKEPAWEAAAVLGLLGIVAQRIVEALFGGDPELLIGDVRCGLRKNSLQLLLGSRSLVERG